MPSGLELETLTFTPRSGAFDEAATGAHVLTIGFAFRDEIVPTTFVVTASEELRDAFQTYRTESPDDGFPYTMLVDVTPDAILLTPPVEDELVPLWRAFIGWLMARYPCQVINDLGTDLTGELAVAYAAA